MRTYDTAEFLRDEEDIRLYLETSFEEGDPEQIVTAIGNVARARNMAKLARSSGVSREGLYKAFWPKGNPSFANVLKVIGALGFQFEIKPIAKQMESHAEAVRS